MRTKMAEKVLKRNSKRMDRLGVEFRKLARQLQSLSASSAMDEEIYKTIMAEAKANRLEWQKLQEEINDLCRLEMELPDYRTANPRGSV